MKRKYQNGIVGRQECEPKTPLELEEPTKDTVQ